MNGPFVVGSRRSARDMADNYNIGRDPYYPTPYDAALGRQVRAAPTVLSSPGSEKPGKPSS